MTPDLTLHTRKKIIIKWENDGKKLNYCSGVGLKNSFTSKKSKAEVFFRFIIEDERLIMEESFIYSQINYIST